MLKKLLTQSEVAEYLGVSTRTLSRWRKKGTGPRPTPVGVQVRYRERDVYAWLTELERRR